MIKKIIFILSTITCITNFLHPYSIVFVHIGKQLPAYINEALFQARLFNDQAEIYLIANQNALKHYSCDNIQAKLIPIETLKQSRFHKFFIQKNAWNSCEEFWRYTSERFLLLDDFMQQHDIQDVFHIENDTLLYANLDELMPIFTAHYPGIAAIFDNDERCIPCFMYIRHKTVMSELARFFCKHANKGKNDMQIIAMFKQKNKPAIIDNLPIIMDSYRNKLILKSSAGHCTTSPEAYSKNIDIFNAIFDAAALGQYLGGIDPKIAPIGPGFINESCLFDPAHLKFEWKIDELGRKVPFAIFENKMYRINNLHIHCKDLKRFMSIKS